MQTVELMLCETQFLFLKPNINYVFKVAENCENCKLLERIANGEYETVEDQAAWLKFQEELNNFKRP